MIPRHHHYVPQWLSSRWANHKRQIWVVNRNNSRIFKTNIKNVFSKRDLNTIFDRDGNPNTVIEDKFYGSVDSQLSSTTEKICKNVLNNNPPIFDSLESKTAFLSETIRIQMMRAPDALNPSMGILDYQETIDEVKELRVVEGSFTPEEEAEISSQAFKASVIRDSKIYARLTRPSEQMMLAFENSLVEFFVTSPGCSFILSDGVIDGKIGFSSVGGSSMLMPIHPRVAFRPLMERGKSRSTVIRHIQRNELRQINERLFWQSELVAAVTDVQLLSLAKRFNLQITAS